MAYPVVPLIPAGNESLVSSAILQNAATSDGTGTDYDITGMATVQALVKPTSYTGTITFYISIDGTTFVKILGNQVDTTTIADNVANPESTASLWTFQVGGATKFRAALTSSGGTSVTVTAAASPVTNGCPLGVTLSSAVLAAGSALIGGVNVVDSAGTNKLAVDSSGRLTLVPNQVVELGDGTTPTQKLAIDSSGRLTLVPNQVFELGDGTTPTQKLAVDSSGNAAVALIKVGANATPLGHGTSAAALRVELPTDGTGQVKVVDSAGTNQVGVDASHNIQITDGGTATVVITASSAGAVKAATGRLCRVLTTSTATAAVNIYDNTNAASGTIIATVPSGAAVGTVYSPQMPAAVGIYVGGGAGTPGLTVSYS